MHPSLSRFFLAVLAVLLWGCAGTPPAPEPIEIKPPQARLGSGQLTLEGGFILDYKFDTRLSKLDGTSCFVLVTGHLSNPGNRRLQRHSRLDFRVFAGSEMVFRDGTQPRSDLPPGSRVQIEMIQSPLFSKHCPRFDRLEVNLLRVY